MKHTPGPWEMRELKGYQSSDPVFLIEGNTTLHLMVVAFPDGHVVGENEANARLIAAAPDLLEACKALPDFDLESPDAADFVDHSSSFARAMILAREAIAKATNA